MKQQKIVLVIGGSRSGKSEFAEQLAIAGEEPVYYLATGVVTDAEMEERVEQHRKQRPSHWQTIEAPLRPDMAIRQLKGQQGILLMDSLSSWMTNLLYEDNLENWQWSQAKEEQALAAVETFLEKVKTLSLRCIIVGDEVGMGLVPPTAEGRAFRDLNGRANQLVASVADSVYLVTAGLPLKIK